MIFQLTELRRDLKALVRESTRLSTEQRAALIRAIDSVRTAADYSRVLEIIKAALSSARPTARKSPTG